MIQPAQLEDENTGDANFGGVILGEESVDVFHRGRFSLVQPVKCGHRAGMDAMMLAAAVPDDFSGHVVDLGAGAGAAGFAVVARCPLAKATLVERSPLMLAYAAKSYTHPVNVHLQSRLHILGADVSLRGRERVDAGLLDNSFDFAIMNPPFNDHSDRATPDETRAEAHVMEEGLFENWLRTAAAIVRPSGSVALIARPISIDAILAAMEGRFGGVVIVPIYPRCGRAAIRIIVYGKRASRARLSIAPALVLHEGEERQFSPQAEAIGNGICSLWDGIEKASLS